MTRESTVQQLDPIGGRAAEPLTVSAAISIVAFAVVMTVVGAHDIDYPGMAILALALVGLVACLLVYRSMSLRAPLTRTTHVVLLTLAMVALLLNSLSMGPTNEHLRDDWGPPVVGLLLLALCPYRPPRELAGFGSLAAIFTGFIVIARYDSYQVDAPAFVFVVEAITPIVAMCYIGAMFSSVLISMMRRWQWGASSAVRAIASERLESITRSVQQDRVTILNRDVVPFFAHVLAADDITDADRDRAREISDAIRRVMIAEADRSWLAAALDQLVDAPTNPISLTDDLGLADAMSIEQRAALRAAIVAIDGSPALLRGSLAVDLARRDHAVHVVISARFTRPVRTEIEPYLAVLRVLFIGLTISFSKPILTVRFSYELR